MSTSTSNNVSWLLKSEPSEYSIQQLQQDQQEEWNGVRNYSARNHLKNMKSGDRCFFYHSSCQTPSIVGTCRVVREAQPDATAVDPSHSSYDAKSTPDNNRWVSVLVEFEDNFQTPITIKELREQASVNPVIANMMLLRQSRLSVMPVIDEESEAIFELQSRKARGDDLLSVEPTTAARPTKRAATNKTDDSESNKKSKKTKSTIATNVSSEKETKTTRNTNSSNLTVDDPNYCSNPSLMLSDSQLHAIQADTCTKITEQELGLKGRKHLYKIQHDENTPPTLVMLFEGGKFIGKDRQRLQTMVDAAKELQPLGDVYVLLSSNSGICKRNTLPQLIADGIIVQRVSA
jgi:predicted RNA-binding protein with PUA-like domain